MTRHKAAFQTVILAFLVTASVIAPFAGPIGNATAQSADDPVIWTSGDTNTSTYFYQNGTHSTQYLNIGIEFGGGEDYAIQIVNNSIYMVGFWDAGSGRKVRKYDPNGTLIWGTSSYNAAFAEISGGGFAYLDSDNAGGVAKINQSGQEVYNKQIGTFGSSWDTMAVQEVQNNYIALSAAAVEDFGLYTENGTVVYEKSGLGRYTVLALESTAGTPNLFAATDDNATLFSPTGTELWNVSRPTSDTAVTGAYTDDIVYLGTLTGNVSAFDTDTGAHLWTTDLNPSASNQPIDMIFGPDGELYVGTSGGMLVNLDTAGNRDYITATPGSGNIAFATELVEPAGPTPTPTPEGFGLELDIDRWQAPNSSQPYRVLFTNSSGEFDVTDSATVTSDNSTVLTVNTTAQTLEGFGGNATANVTADYQGDNVTVQVTVATRTLDNIGILPPEQWICGFLECDGASGGVNIGSAMQWILLIIMLMAVGSRMFDNPWAGIGGGMILSILVWILGYVDLGVVLSTVFATILLGLILVRTRRARGVNISRG